MRKTKYKRSEVSLYEIGKIIGIIALSRALIYDIENDRKSFTHLIPHLKKELDIREKSMLKKMTQVIDEYYSEK